jgi:phosphoserine phosphatase
VGARAREARDGSLNTSDRLTDIAIQLAFFDVDGTLKAERDPYLYLHRQLGTEEQGLASLEMFERGEIDYDEWGQLDAQLWAGQEAARITRLLADIPWTPGARQVITALRQAGVKIALISSGLDLHVNPVAAEIDAAFAFANQLCVADGHLTGELRILVPQWGKGDVVGQVMAQSGLSAPDCIAVGDGLADVAMFERVGWSVAVAPDDERVRAGASLTLDEPDLTPLVSILARDFLRFR